MRLLHTTTLRLEEFPDERGLSYAILSHRWGDGEVTFQQMKAGDPTVIACLTGYAKIYRFCAEAKKNGFTYAWIDTCCIDKTSSAELQEAINSMFRWYRDAKVCYVHLSDWVNDASAELGDSEWFYRGWTLQELIAPHEVRFYDRNWTYFGTRSELADRLIPFTKVPYCILEGDKTNLSRYSIAERMSWARGRKTTRVEDRAYSLLGLFDVNMPMLYGEGEKAFTRLQEEILKKTTDQSILTWNMSSAQNHSMNILSKSPDDFPAVSSETEWENFYRFERRGSHSITNEGLSIEVKLAPWKPRVYLALLNYQGYWRRNFYEEGIFLRALDRDGYFIRVKENDNGIYRGTVNTKSPRPNKFVRVTIVHTLLGESEQRSISLSPYAGFQYSHCDLQLESLFTQAGTHGCASTARNRAGYLMLNSDYLPMCIKNVILGFDFDFCPLIVIEWSNDTTPDTSDTDSFDEDLDDGHVNRKPFLLISGMEEKGWIPIRCKTGKISKRGRVSNIWPFRLEWDQLSLGTYACSIPLNGYTHGNKTVAKGTVVLSRWSITKPWNVCFLGFPDHKVKPEGSYEWSWSRPARFHCAWAEFDLSPFPYPNNPYEVKDYEAQYNDEYNKTRLREQSLTAS